MDGSNVWLIFVVVVDLTKDAAVPAPGLGDEPVVEPRARDAAVGPRLEPVPLTSSRAPA